MPDLPSSVLRFSATPRLFRFIMTNGAETSVPGMSLRAIQPVTKLSI